MTKIKVPMPKGCRNPHEGENPLITVMRILKKKDKKEKPIVDWKDKVIY